MKKIMFFFCLFIYSLSLLAQMPEIRNSFHFATEDYDDGYMTCHFDINDQGLLILSSGRYLTHVSRGGVVDWTDSIKTYQQRFNNSSVKRHGNGFLVLDSDSLFFFSNGGNRQFIGSMPRTCSNNYWESYIDEVESYDGDSLYAMVNVPIESNSDISLFTKDSLKLIKSFSIETEVKRVLYRILENQLTIVGGNYFFNLHINNLNWLSTIPGVNNTRIKEIVAKKNIMHFVENVGKRENSDTLAFVKCDFFGDSVTWSQQIHYWGLKIYSIIPINNGFLLLGGAVDSTLSPGDIVSFKSLIIRVHCDGDGNFLYFEDYRQLSDGWFSYARLDEHNWLWTSRHMLDKSSYPYKNKKYIECFYIEGFSHPLDDVPNEGSPPSEFILSQNYPNPFNPETSIDFNLPEAGIASLKIYDVLGREVATIFDSYKESGNQTVKFDGSSLPSGVYFYRLESSKNSQSRKMILLK